MKPKFVTWPQERSFKFSINFSAVEIPSNKKDVQFFRSVKGNIKADKKYGLQFEKSMKMA